jgi:hypothetical protein
MAGLHGGFRLGGAMVALISEKRKRRLPAGAAGGSGAARDAGGGGVLSLTQPKPCSTKEPTRTTNRRVQLTNATAEQQQDIEPKLMLMS